MTADPNNWVKNPPSTFVKIVETSKEDLNNTYGLVVQYSSDRGRYVVIRSNEEQVSLKPANLLQCGMLEQYKAQYDFLTKSPTFKRELGTQYSKWQARFGGYKPEYVLLVLVVIIVLSSYFFGFRRVSLLVSLLVMLYTVCSVDIDNGSSLALIVRNFPMRLRTLIRTQVPYGEKFADNPMVVPAFCLLVVYFTYVGFKPTKVAPPVSVHQPSMPVESHLREEFYKLGFNDAAEGNPFGTSLKQPIKVADFAAGNSPPDPSLYDFPPPTKPSSSLFSFSNIASSFYIGKTLYEAGRGTDGSWNPQRMIANLQTLPAWQLGMLGFSLYRLFF